MYVYKLKICIKDDQVMYKISLQFLLKIKKYRCMYQIYQKCNKFPNFVAMHQLILEVLKNQNELNILNYYYYEFIKIINEIINVNVSNIFKMY